MARTILTTVAVATPSPTQAEAALNAVFAGLPAAIIKAFDLVLTDQSPVTSRALRAVIDTESGGQLLADQFRAKVFLVEDEGQLADEATTFMAQNPAWFYAPIIYLYSDQIQGESRRSVAVLVYTSDAANGASNWQVGGGGGGSGSGTTWLNGNGAPGAGLGSNGDYYIDDASDAIYRKDAGAWVYLGSLSGSGTMIGTPTVEVAFDSGSPVAIGTPSANALIRKVSVVVDAAFDAVGATLSIGTAGDPDRYMTTAQNLLDVEAVFNVEPMYQEDALPEAIIVTFVPGAGGTQGSARVTVEYSNP